MYFTTFDNATGETPHNGAMIRQIEILYAGCIISIFFILVALITYTTNKFLRVKRQHIISINLCISLLIFYVGLLVALISQEQNISKPGGTTAQESLSPSCIASAVLIFAGWFFILFWILADWLFFSYTIHQWVSRHISHFFIKTAVPTYGSGLFLLIIVVSMDAAAVDRSFIHQSHCWYELNEREVELLFFLMSGICTILIIACAVFCCVKFSCGDNKKMTVTKVKKNKRTLIRLTILTIIVFVTSIPHLSLWLITRGAIGDVGPEYDWLKILDGIFTGLEGILVVICLSFRTSEFRAYWTAVFKGKDPTVTRSFRISRSNTRLSKRAINSVSENVANDDNVSERTVKIEPRDQAFLEITVDDEVFLSTSKNASPVPSPLAVTKQSVKKPRAATLQSERYKSPEKVERKGERSEASPSTLMRLNSLRRKMMRGSFRRPNKSSISSQFSATPPDTPPPNTTLTLNRFRFNRDSSISLTTEHERKTSF